MSSTEQDVYVTRLSGPEVPCHLSHDPLWERLTVIEYGQVWDGQLPDEYLMLEEEERIQFLAPLEGPPVGGVKGLIVHEPFEVKPLEIDSDELWEEPRFEVPTLGLTGASVGEVILAVQARYTPDEPTMDAAFFHMAIHAKEAGNDEEALGYWRGAIEAGDMKARFGLGYTLYDLGRYREAYDHLRLYTELTPHNAWAWCWYGMACEKLGERRSAIGAYRHAVEMERQGGLETDAAERLHILESR